MPSPFGRQPPQYPEELGGVETLCIIVPHYHSIVSDTSVPYPHLNEFYVRASCLCTPGGTVFGDLLGLFCTRPELCLPGDALDCGHDFVQIYINGPWDVSL